MTAYIMTNYQNLMMSFVQEYFPGFDLKDEISILVPMFTSRNPNATLTNLALNNIDQPCVNGTSIKHCDPGYVLDASTGLCYLALKFQANYWMAVDACLKIGAELVGFDNNDQAKGLVSLLNNGNFSLCS